MEEDNDIFEMFLELMEQLRSNENKTHRGPRGRTAGETGSYGADAAAIRGTIL